MDLHVHCGPEGIRGGTIRCRSLSTRPRSACAHGPQVPLHRDRRLGGDRAPADRGAPLRLRHAEPSRGRDQPVRRAGSAGSGRRDRQLPEGGLAAHGPRRRVTWRRCARAGSVTTCRPSGRAASCRGWRSAWRPSRRSRCWRTRSSSRLDDVLRLVAAHRLVLATGHVGRDEVFHVVDGPARSGWTGSW